MLTRRRLLGLVGTAVGAAALGAGCGRRDRPILERIRETGQLRVGISGEEPFAYLDSAGRVTGEAPAVAEHGLRGLGVGALEAVQRPFGQLVDGLLAGHFDLITAAMRITPDRCQRVVFSRPDLLTPSAFLVPRGNPRRIRTFADVARAAVPIAVLERQRRAGQGPRRPHPRRPDHARQLAERAVPRGLRGRPPVGSLTDISLRRLLGRHPAARLQVTAGVTETLGDRTTQPAASFAFRPTDAPLRDAFNAGLTAPQTSGDWLRVTEPFGVTPVHLPPGELTTTDLCRAP